jgi:hypothetical protein
VLRLNKKQLMSFRFVVILLTCLCLMPAISLAQDDSDNLKDNLRLLSWLMIDDSIAQVDSLIEQYTSQQSLLLAELSLTDQQAQELKQQLLSNSGSSVIRENVQRYFVDHLPPGSDEAAQILSQGLPVRARNFDVVWLMSSVEQKWQAYQQTMVDNPPSEKRSALLQRLDHALKTSAIAALIQTEIDTTVKTFAAQITDAPPPAIITRFVKQQYEERQKYLEDKIVELHLFSYRYMKDAELQSYVEQMELPSIKAAVNVAQSGLQQALIDARLKAQDEK